MVDSRRENGLWPEAARDTNRPHSVDVSFLADIVMARSERPGDNRTVALLARKCREMEIMLRSFFRADERSIPGHWRHHPVVNNRLIAQPRNFGHRALLLCATRH